MMNRKTNKYKTVIYWIVLFSLLASGCNEKTDKIYSEVRFADFLLPDHSFRMKIDGMNEKIVDLSYGEATSAVRLEEGSYVFSVIDKNDKVIIEKKLGIGKNTNYTVTVSGILIPSDARKNAMTLKTKLLEAAEGATAHPGNAAMPIMSVFLDRFEGNPQNGKLKAIHMCPGMDDLDIFIHREGEFKKLASVSYPKPTERDYSLPPSTYRVEIRYKSSSVVLYKGKVTVKGGHLTTLFIFGNPEAYPYEISAKTLINQDEN